MKTIIKIALISCLSLLSLRSYAQSQCEENLMKFTSSIDADSLQAGLSLILTIDAFEDIPFYEETRFTSSPANPQYFLIKKSNPDVSLGYKVFDWDKREIQTETIAIEEEGAFLIELKKHQSGNYKIVLYSKHPDGSCMSISFLKKEKKGKISIPSSNLNQNADLKDLTLLKEYNENIKVGDLPYVSERSYVLTKNTDYYFYWEENANLKLKVMNSKRKDQPLLSVQGSNRLKRFNCENTGIYYFIIYAKEAMPQNALLKFYFDEESRKSN